MSQEAEQGTAPPTGILLGLRAGSQCCQEGGGLGCRLPPPCPQPLSRSSCLGPQGSGPAPGGGVGDSGHPRHSAEPSPDHRALWGPQGSLVDRGAASAPGTPGAVRISKQAPASPAGPPRRALPPPWPHRRMEAQPRGANVHPTSLGTGHGTQHSTTEIARAAGATNIF